MAGLKLAELTGFPRTVQVDFPHPTKAGKEMPVQLRARFKHLDSEEYKNLMGINPKTLKPNFTQKEIFDEFVEWVNPEDVDGVETKDEAKEACSHYICIQNAFINDYAECISGFARKNLKK